MKKKYCDVGQHECDKLFHARTKERLSSCAIHAPRTPIKVKKGDVIEYNAKNIHGELYRATGRILHVIPIPQKNKASQKPKKRLEEQSVKELLKLAEIVFNRWIRKRDAKSDGTFKCISCGLWKSTKEMDCGHFIGKRNSYLRFSEDNCHGECISCNRFDDSHLTGYSSHIQEKLGYERYQQLLTDRVKSKKWSREELLQLIEKYK